MAPRKISKAQGLKKFKEYDREFNANARKLRQVRDKIPTAKPSEKKELIKKKTKLLQDQNKVSKKANKYHKYTMSDKSKKRK